MYSVKESHEKSMNYAECTIIARNIGNNKEVWRLSKDALKWELLAIDAAKEEKIEPTYSILLLSAATLATDCKEYKLSAELKEQYLEHTRLKRIVK